MNAFPALAWSYWRDGGLLMFPLAAVSLAMIYHLLFCRLKLAAALSALRAHPGLPAADASEQIREEIQRDFVVIRALAACAPLIGLLGTVAGMIQTFSGVASGQEAAGGLMADGIRQALVTTQAGLIIAIPGLFGLARLQRLLDQLAIAAELAQRLETP